MKKLNILDSSGAKYASPCSGKPLIVFTVDLTQAKLSCIDILKDYAWNQGNICSPAHSNLQKWYFSLK